MLSPLTTRRRTAVALAIALALMLALTATLAGVATAAPNRGIEDLLEEFPLGEDAPATEPAPAPEPAPEPEPAPVVPQPDPAPASDSGGGNGGILLIAAGLAIVAGGGALAVAAGRRRRRRAARPAPAAAPVSPDRTGPTASGARGSASADPAPVAPTRGRDPRPAPNPLEAPVRWTPRPDVARAAEAAQLTRRPAPSPAPAPARIPPTPPARPVAAPTATARGPRASPFDAHIRPSAPAAVNVRGGVTNPFDAHVRPTAAPAPLDSTAPAGPTGPAPRPAPVAVPPPPVAPEPPRPAIALEPPRPAVGAIPDLGGNGADPGPAVGTPERNGAGPAEPLDTAPAPRDRLVGALARGANAYGEADCARFAAGLNAEILDRAILLFGALARHGRVGSFRLAELLGAAPGELGGLLLTPLRRRADALNLGLPFVTDTVKGSRARIWRDAAGLAGRMERALRAEELARAEEAAAEPLERYRPLTAALLRLEGGEVTWTLREIEAMIGAELPVAARTWRRWWANRADADAHVQARAWLEVGMLAFPELRADRVTFRPPATGRRGR